MHIHFRANMDFWDPLLFDSIACDRQVILFDQAGVGRSTGEKLPTYQGWAEDLIAFVSALNLKQVDLFSFSTGRRCVQMVALTAPNLVRKLIVAGSGPSEPFIRLVQGKTGWHPLAARRGASRTFAASESYFFTG